MTLTARMKDLGYRELRSAGWPPTQRALCGYVRCREQLALVTLVRGARGEATAWNAALAAGYREYAPGQWALGRHALRSRRHAPRRLRFTGLSSGQPAPGYIRDGAYIIRGPAGQPDMQLQVAHDPQGRRASAPQEVSLTLTERLTVTCARCGRVSTLTALPLLDALIEALNAATSIDLGGGGTAEKTV